MGVRASAAEYSTFCDQINQCRIPLGLMRSKEALSHDCAQGTLSCGCRCRSMVSQPMAARHSELIRVSLGVQTETSKQVLQCLKNMPRKYILLLWVTCVLCACASKREQQAEQQAFDAYLQLAVSFLQQGDYPATENQLERAAELRPYDVRLLNVYGLLYQAQGNYERADQSFRDGLALRPDNAIINNNYGVLLSMQGKHQTAYPYFQRAINDATYPNRALAYENLGDAAERAEDFATARQAFQQALEIAPRRWILYLKQARIHFYEAQFERAFHLFQTYIETLKNLNIVPSRSDLELGRAIANAVKDWVTADLYREWLEELYETPR